MPCNVRLSESKRLVISADADEKGVQVTTAQECGIVGLYNDSLSKSLMAASLITPTAP